MSAIEKIKQYGRRLEKHADDKMVLKETLQKLDKIEVTVDILQQTGIGKIVNCIKKRSDSAGVMATDLIRKWRKVVDREAETAEVDSEEKPAIEDSKSKRPHQEDVKSHHHKSSSQTVAKAGNVRHTKPSHEPVSEPELFSDAVLTIKKEVKEEPSNRSHSKDVSSRNAGSSSSSKDRRKDQGSHHTQHKEEDSSRRSHKDEGKSRKVEKHDRSQHRTSHSKSTEPKREKEIGGAVQSKTERKSRCPEEAKAPRTSASLDGSTVKQEAGSSKERERGRKRKASEEGEEAEGMNAQNFGSFEDCLGSIEPKKAKNKKRRLNGSKQSAAASPKMTVTSSALNGSISKPKGPRLPDLLDAKKPPESHCNPIPMPQLVTDYKPLPRVEPRAAASSSVVAPAAAHRTMTNEEAVMFTSSRKDRTAVYSGRKQPSLSTVPTLYEACVRVLVEHVDLIDETGGVPFEIMRPIMERCTWQQLYRLEYYNPILTEDSDPLWETHVRRDFRGKTPAKGEETWRELYLRCHDEREQKLKDLKESIGQSMKAKQAPVRMTKLAYVDSMAKPPRNVQRAQLKHGTQVANRAKPSQARSIAAQASTSTATEPVRAPTAAPKKAKPAPLMAKTLMFLKMRKTTGYGYASR